MNMAVSPASSAPASALDSVSANIAAPARQPFNPKVVLALLVFGALAFFATLYFIGSGNTGGTTNDGGAHAASKGLIGYAALASLLERDGRDVTVSRNPGAMEKRNLLIITPEMWGNADEISDLIRQRRYIGPTLVILPKWYSYNIPESMELAIDHEDGWVVLADTSSPDWFEELPDSLNGEAAISALEKSGPAWAGLGYSGALPDPKQVQSMTSRSYASLVTDSSGHMLAGYLDDGGHYPELAAFADKDSDHLVVDEDGYDQHGNYVDQYMSAVVFVAEPDLMNNFGMADRSRAQVAVAMIDALAYDEASDEDLPIVFDVTMNGLGLTQNLLTLAFTPPFIAATLCLILAMIMIGWRAFFRFGPPLAEARAIAFGKGRLVANSAAFILRTRRFHLLTEPYVALVRGRVVTSLALHHPEDSQIDEALARRGVDGPYFTQRAATLKNAHGPRDILRAAMALKDLERTIAR
ncbi:MAG: DUF4350 domain-containing protein [Sphingomonadaceae bacterium]